MNLEMDFPELRQSTDRPGTGPLFQADHRALPAMLRLQCPAALSKWAFMISGPALAGHSVSGRHANQQSFDRHGLTLKGDGIPTASKGHKP